MIRRIPQMQRTTSIDQNRWKFRIVAAARFCERTSLQRHSVSFDLLLLLRLSMPSNVISHYQHEVSQKASVREIQYCRFALVLYTNVLAEPRKRLLSKLLMMPTRTISLQPHAARCKSTNRLVDRRHEVHNRELVYWQRSYKARLCSRASVWENIFASS